MDQSLEVFLDFFLIHFTCFGFKCVKINVSGYKTNFSAFLSN